MIRGVWRTILKVLGSAVLALWLLVFVGVWATAATLIPQGPSSSREVAAWAAQHGGLESAVRLLGMHQAFTSPAFLAGALLLALSTAVCSWNRTKVGLGRSRRLRAAATADERAIIEKHDLEIACDSDLSAQQVLDIASETLLHLGVKTRRRGSVLFASSSPWSVWGSTVFHWALVALFVAAFAGIQMRSEGSMSIAVGQTKPDAPQSYSAVSTGPWHDWARVHRSVRVDAFDPDLTVGHIDRGAVPTLSILDGAGKVVVTQRVYPNMKLHSGSLSINAPGVGLVAYISVLNPSGTEVGRITQLVDFSQTTSGGTVPQAALVYKDSITGADMKLTATVPLDRAGASYGEWIPAQPSAHVQVTSSDGHVRFDRVLREGQTAELPGAGVLRLRGIGWYSRLALVDDPTIPLIYASMILAMLGLTLSVAARQLLLVSTVAQGPGGASFVMQLRVWRNAPTNLAEIQSELARALGIIREGERS